MKQVKTVIISNNGNDGQLTLIISDGTLEEDGQRSIEFDIPFTDMDIGFSVDCYLNLKEQSPDYREN